MPAELIKRSIHNDVKAQRLLYEQYRQSWFMTCLRYARNRTEAEDFFQDGLLSIFKELNQFDAQKSTFITWSSRVMINAGLQYLRKWRRLDNLTVEEEYGIHREVTTDVYDDLSAQELTRMVQNLPEGYKVVFNMYVIEGYKHREIADILEISINTSKTQLFKAKKTLKTQIELLFQNEYIHEG